MLRSDQGCMRGHGLQDSGDAPSPPGEKQRFLLNLCVLPHPDVMPGAATASVSPQAEGGTRTEDAGQREEGAPCLLVSLCCWSAPRSPPDPELPVLRVANLPAIHSLQLLPPGAGVSFRSRRCGGERGRRTLSCSGSQPQRLVASALERSAPASWRMRGPRRGRSAA